MAKAKWEIRPRGRKWRAGEALSRYYMAPEKIEMVNGKLFDTDEQRVTMLALLLENMGAEAAVSLGDPNVWREAIAKLS